MKSLIAIPLLLAAAAAPLRAQDVIKFKDPKKNPDVEGEIASLSFKTVEIDVLGVRQQIPARSIADLVPLRKSPEYKRVEEALSDGDAALATARFERVASDEREPALLRQRAAILIVRSQTEPQGIVRSVRDLRKRWPEGFFVPESFQREALAHLAMENVAAAKASIAAFGALAAAQARQDWADAAELLDAGLAELQKNWRGALALYRKHGRNPELRDDAALGELRCLTALADFPALKARAEEIIKGASGTSDANPRVLIAAYTGRGDVERNAGKVKDALLCYLQGAMVLARGETSREHETSLARGALACAALVVPETDAARREIYRLRTQELLQELLANYPGSRYRKEIQETLLRLR
jgi:hypothetical protein